MNSNKRWSIAVLSFALILLIVLGAITIIVDPYFHYHAPLNFLEYPINNERYQNDGILKHFEYDAIITGTSMTENFKTSEFDSLFHVNSIKIPFSGASYKEINENLERALEVNPDIQLVVRGLDYDKLGDKKDFMAYPPEFYPVYLYDRKIYNDVNYIFNKSILLKDTYSVFEHSKSGGRTTDFDSYANWNANYTFGKDAVDAVYTRKEKVSTTTEMTEEDHQNLLENLEQNITQLVEDNPQIDFYLFFTPYSIYYWDSLNQSGNLKRQLELEKETIKALLIYENVYLFSFFNEFDMICDLNNYKDSAHYGENVNSLLLLWMCKKEHMLTRDNYEEYCDEIFKFYTTYDYDALF